MPAKRLFRQKTIAIVYDFDGTLTPRPMQEYTILPELGVEPEKFWQEVQATARTQGAEQMLTYMRLICERISNGSHIGKQQFKALAKNIEYFEGVEGWFSRMNQYVADHKQARGVILRHYIISAGLKEILDGASIRSHFHRIYASEYHYNSHDVPTFPKVVITDTVKTQFLFRINKGREELHESINEHMDEEDRPIPFSNMIYIGDGLSDVPCMTVCKGGGGHSVAVYGPSRRNARETCSKLFGNGRVDFMAPADYREGKALDGTIKLILDSIIADIRLCRAHHALRMRLNPLSRPGMPAQPIGNLEVVQPVSVRSEQPDPSVLPAEGTAPV